MLPIPEMLRDASEGMRLAEHDELIGNLSCHVVALANYVRDLQAMLDRSRLDTRMLEGTIDMACSRLGGLVEGHRPQRINFLQRIDELVRKEADMDPFGGDDRDPDEYV
jgi:hypothetical protein